MALTVSIVDRCSVANLVEHRGTIGLGVYVAGGIPYTAATFGFSQLRFLDFPASYYDEVAGTPFLLVGGRGKIAAFVMTGAQEVANGIDLGNLKIPFFARGIV